MAALALVNELESNIQIGVPITTSVVLALHEFRKVQTETDRSYGADLDRMYKQHLESEMARVEAKIGPCPVVELAKLRRSKIKPI
jgi:hypothetical protein